MDYQRIYDEFISDRRARQPEDGGDWHHILPRCKNGGDEPENLIRLSVSDHLFAHLLLAKIHGGDLILALILMLDHERYQGRRSRRRYEKARQDWRSEAARRAVKHWDKPGQREAQRLRALEQWSDPERREIRRRGMIGNKNAAGCVRSPETRAKISASRKAAART